MNEGASLTDVDPWRIPETSMILDIKYKLRGCEVGGEIGSAKCEVCIDAHCSHGKQDGMRVYHFITKLLAPNGHQS